MEAKKLYEQLETDFIKPGLTDDWARHMAKVQRFLSDNFKSRSMGLVCDNSQEIRRVYTAVFPTKQVMERVLQDRDSLLFVHHPSTWRITKKGVWQQMSPALLRKFQAQMLSIYNLHVPLDNFGDYSTSSTLAKALHLEIEKPFAPYHGGLAGVITKSSTNSTERLSKTFRLALGHRVKLYPYGAEIANSRVAVVAGGGNDIGILKEVLQEGVNTLVTGISVLSDYSKPAHDFARENKINILGGTHYSTEKFACQALCGYFQNLGLESSFIEGKPGFADL